MVGKFLVFGEVVLEGAEFFSVLLGYATCSGSKEGRNHRITVNNTGTGMCGYEWERERRKEREGMLGKGMCMCMSMGVFVIGVAGGGASTDGQHEERRRDQDQGDGDWVVEEKAIEEKRKETGRQNK